MAGSVVNWNAIYTWVTAAGVRCGTALYNLWKRYKGPRRIETGYEKVQRGETIDGWKMVISPDRSSAVYATTANEGGIMRRWINPPSLKHLAAEAFCRANPNVDLYRLKNEIGFDVFDGILDDDEDTAPIIHL